MFMQFNLFESEFMDISKMNKKLLNVFWGEGGVHTDIYVNNQVPCAVVSGHTCM